MVNPHKHALLRITGPVLITVLILVIGLIALIPLFTYAYYARTLTTKEGIMNSNNTGIILTDRTGTPFFKFYQAHTAKPVPISRIPTAMQQAVIAAEDKNFYTHPGFSLPSILRSLYVDILRKEFAFGGSTITQQLVKNALLNPSKNILRKYQELVLAAEIERRYSKKEILEMYLNSVYFGEGAFGVDAAAQTYFGKHADELTLAESALLTGILPAPSLYSPISGNREIAIDKQRTVLARMKAEGYISAEEVTSAQNQKLTFTTISDDLNNLAPHFALMVRDELIKKYGEESVARSGFTIRTTVNLDWQKYAEDTVKSQVTRLSSNGVSNGAAAAIDPHTGEIMALVGSADWYDEKFGKVNMATTPRQPGSSFKPIIYAAALEKGLITNATMLPDKPTTFAGGYKPHNYDNGYRGDVLVRRALANSLNIPAVDVMSRLGVEEGVAAAERMGVSLEKPSSYGLSLVLGAAEVPLIQMTNVYAAFAAQGSQFTPTTILEITDKNGKSVYSYQPESHRVLDARVAFLISSILSDRVTRAETFGSALTITQTAAVKTGTTEDYRDAWTLGYTPDLAVGVWVGNNDNTPMDNIAGSLGAAPIWRQLMTRYLQTLPRGIFTPPPGIAKASICAYNGLLAQEATSSAYLEYFLEGTAPTRPCNGGSVLVPSSTPTHTPIPSPTISPSPTAAPQNTPTETPPLSPTPEDIPTLTITIIP